MLFSTPLFLFVFLPATLLAYFLAPRAARNTILLGLSLLFYAWGEPKVVFIVAASAVLEYWLGPKVARPGPAGARWLALGVGLNLGLLFVYKYADFALDNLAPLTGPLPHLGLALPLGLSFIVFEKITYLVDIRRGVGTQARSLRDYLLFVFLFPKVLAGPIIKYHEVDEALRDRASTWDDRTWGFLRFLWGLARKVLIADVCGEVADGVFGQPGGDLGFSSAWLGVAAFTAQIYFDFAAYSDMAIGLARMFGFKIPENFNHPYGSVNFTEFWRRWHISLTTWIRSYLYIPLGGNRHGPLRTYANLWICFLLSGLWHGASWTFVLWGAWNGLFLVLDRQPWMAWTQRLPAMLRVGGTLFLVMVGWAIFRAESTEQMTGVLSALFNPADQGAFVWLQAHQAAAIAIGLGGALIAAAPPVRALAGRAAASPTMRALAAAVIVALAAFALAKVVSVTFRPFLYFRF